MINQLNDWRQSIAPAVSKSMIRPRKNYCQSEQGGRRRDRCQSKKPVVLLRLFVSYASTRRPSQWNHFGPAEANLATPPGEISTGEVEGVAEFDQHVERHHQSEGVLPPGVVDNVLDDDERTAGRQGSVSCADELQLLLEIPVVQNHAHRNDIGLRQRIGEKIDSLGGDPIGKSGGGNLARGYRRSGGEIGGGAAQVRMLPGDEHRQLTGGAAHVTQRAITGKIELLGQRLKIGRGDAAHRVHELFEPLGLAVKLGEHRRAGVFDLVLGAAGAQSVSKIAPESV